MLHSRILSQTARKIQPFYFLHQIGEQSLPIQNKLKHHLLNKRLIPELHQIWAVFNSHGQELRISGPAALELIQSKNLKDDYIELRTTATPEKMRQMFCETDTGIQLIPLKGERYGSAIAKIDDNSQGYEIFTTRVYDNESRLAFTEDWSDDAQHRDFTINSICIDFQGNIYDYANGLEDFSKKHIKFVSNDHHRLGDDPLRILKYFRLHDQLFDGQGQYDSSILSIFAQYAENLANVMGERIWLELKKILKSNSNISAMKTLAELGLVKYLGLPGFPNVEELQSVWSKSFHLNPHVMTLFVALLKNQEELITADKRLKFTKGDRNPLAEFNLATFLMQNRHVKPEIEKCSKVYKDIIIESHGNEPDLKILIGEILKYQGRADTIQDILKWKMPVFPIDKHNLKHIGVNKGPDMALAVREIKKLWKETNYQATAKELLEQYIQIKGSLQAKHSKS